MDGKTLGDIFQEILAELSEMEPTSLDELEKKIKDILRRLGECIMEWKLEDWDVDLRKEICWECGAKLENRKRERQIAMSVSDVKFQRYRSSCPGCGKIEYPHHLCEKVKQRLSPVFGWRSGAYPEASFEIPQEEQALSSQEAGRLHPA
jgi:ribosomal protein L32